MDTTGKGKLLEDFVAGVEETLIPAGFRISKNVKSYDETGVQIDELDIVVRGRIGSSYNWRWLIECRNRKARGDLGWIEQLVGRRLRREFERVSAVSTSGFTKPAVDYARTARIDLRALRRGDPKEFCVPIANFTVYGMLGRPTVAKVPALFMDVYEETGTEAGRLIAREAVFRVSIFPKFELDFRVTEVFKPTPYGTRERSLTIHAPRGFTLRAGSQLRVLKKVERFSDLVDFRFEQEDEST